uniref:DDE Tnp4 domain-containing protein n=1 Tax=Myripristis murdjan TaxID=586833 RepID=A0A667WTX2_9TELE
MATVEEVLLLHLLRKRKKSKTKTRRWNVRPLNLNRPFNGEFQCLVLPMREMDDERHFQYFRMSAPTFDKLLHRIAPRIRHAASHSAPIGESERLAGAWDFDRQLYYQGGVPRSLGRVERRIPQVPRRRRLGDYTPGFLEALAISQLHRGNRRQARTGLFYDAGVFARTGFGAKLIRGQLPLPPQASLPGMNIWTPPVFVADEAFPQKVNLMRPYPGPNLSEDQKVYNFRHSRARRVIENAFGILAARWRILGRAMECCIETAEDITKACVVLHNFLAVSDGDLPESTRGYTAARATQDGLAVREIFKEFFQTDQGMLHWQDQHVRRGTAGLDN